MASFEQLGRRDDGEIQSSRRPTKQPVSAVDALSQLQVTAGNRAVARLLSGGGGQALEVQRMRRGKNQTASGPKEPKGDKLEFDGIVQEALPNAMFRVKADNGLGVLATISGRMRQYYVKILPGDRVTLEVSPYDPTRGRVTYRHK